MPQPRYTRRALQDLAELWLVIAADNPPAADEMLDRIAKKAMMAASYPYLGKLRPDIAPDMRILVETPYILLYRPFAGGAQIVRILHGARDIEDALSSDDIE